MARVRLFGGILGLIISIFGRIEAKRCNTIPSDDITADLGLRKYLGAELAQKGWADQISIFHVGIGFVKSICTEIMYDCDVWGYRSSRVSPVRFVFVYARIRSAHKSSNDLSQNMGESIGRILYRFWYGLLKNPLNK